MRNTPGRPDGVSRREFLSSIGRAALGIGVAGQLAPPLEANPLHMPIGFQGYDARFLLIKDWDQGWQVMRSIGFQSVDLVSFHGYGYENSSLARLTGKAIRQKLDAVGMRCENCQFSYAELHSSFDEKMAFSHDLRLKNVICAPDPGRMTTVDDWKWQADQLNKIGERIQAAGFWLGYHNHDREFVAVDGVIPYDLLMEGTDQKLVRFQIDVGNLTFAGADALVYLHKYAHRYFSLHAKDYLAGKTSVPVGQGSLNWKEIFTAAKRTPIENYFAEVAAYGAGSLHGIPANAWPTDSIDQLRQSYVYLHNLRV